ncbi:MFS transporter, partial [Nonomuraea sp. NPDC049784]
ATLASSRTQSLLADHKSVPAALTGGYHLSFDVATGLLVAGFLIAATVLRSPKAPSEPQAGGAGESTEADRSALPQH